MAFTLAWLRMFSLSDFKNGYGCARHTAYCATTLLKLTLRIMRSAHRPAAAIMASVLGA